jgi:outer membrane lipoprotein-sorting protein
MMKRLFLLSIIILSGVIASFPQTSTIQKVSLSQPEISRIIQKFTENEKQFRAALNEYIFSRSATVQTVGIGGNITGTFRRDSDMTFTSEGSRIEKITFFPVSTLTEISITPEDLEDLGGVNPFALEPAAIPMYDFSYVGKEHIDELDLYVFDVTPKAIPDPKKSKLRLFTGRVWVDDKDLMIVKSKGKAVPETKENKFPVVETWRENIDGKYWFPSFASSDDELVFDNGQVVKLRMRVKYNNYKYGHTDVKIIGEDDTPVPTPSPSPKKP